MDAMMDMEKRAKVQKLKELRKIVREILASEGDVPMEEGVMEDALEEADDAAMEEPEGMGIVEEGSEEEMEEPEEEDELTKMKREYFQPKAEKKSPKGVAISILPPVKPPQQMVDAIQMPKRQRGRV